MVCQINSYFKCKKRNGFQKSITNQLKYFKLFSINYFSLGLNLCDQLGQVKILSPKNPNIFVNLNVEIRSNASQLLAVLCQFIPTKIIFDFDYTIFIS